MTDYSELVKALRHCATRSNGCVTCEGCPMSSENGDVIECINALHKYAAAAIEALQAEIRESMQKCAECGDELAHQMPKRGDIVRCGECKYHMAETERTNPYCNKYHCMRTDDWYCADGEREVQE